MHYVIGDIHGCYNEMITLIGKIENQDKHATFIFVGDFIDRGPDTEKVIRWVNEHITLDGKYQAVRGNHEQEAFFWYRDIFFERFEKRDFSEIPKTTYDFYEVVMNHYINNNGSIEEITKFFDKMNTCMPFNKRLQFTTKSGNTITYRICHASHSYDESLSEIEKGQVNLYKRDYWGLSSNKEIIVHGHTPTIDRDYNLRNPDDRPGLICYRYNDINVDGGCVYFPFNYKEFCNLCAICLETLEEHYAYDYEERIEQILKCKYIDFQKELGMNASNYPVEEFTEDGKEDLEYYNKNTHYRELILNKLL